MENRISTKKETGLLRAGMRRAGASVFAVALAFGTAAPAYATINNTATASGTPTGGTLTPPSDTENVDVETADPELTVIKSADDDTLRNAGETITYTYTVTNTGNVTMDDVSLADTHKGVLGALTIGGDAISSNADPRGVSSDATPDGTWDVLFPGDSITFTATYVVSQADVDAGVPINNSVVANATARDAGAGTPYASAAASESVTVAAPAPALTIAKVGTFDIGAGVQTADGTTDNVPAGTVITYTYTVTNTGNVTINGVEVDDTHKGTPGALSPTNEAILDNSDPRGVSSDGTAADGTWDTLFPGDSVTFTATYTVTQEDVDTLQ